MSESDPTGREHETRQSWRPSYRTVIRAVLAVAAVMATILVYREPVQTVPFMGDETDWISSGNYYSGLLLSGDFTHEKWAANHLGVVGNFNPHLGKILLGLGIRLHPDRDPDDTEYVHNYDWSLTEEANRNRNQVPPDDLLIKGRHSSVVFTVACILALLAAGTLFAGEATGVLLVVLVLTSSTMHIVLGRATTDSYYNFFILTGFLASYPLLLAKEARVFVFWSAMMGLAAGLAYSVKITGLPIVAFYYCLLLPAIWRVRGFQLDTTLFGPAVAVSTTVAVIYVLNPVFWPFEHPRAVLEFPRLFVRTRDMFLDVPDAARMWGDPPDRWGTIHRRLFRSGLMSFRYEPLLFAIGALISAGALIAGLRHKKLNPLGVPFIYFVAQYVFIVSLVQFNFIRYFVPVMFSMKLLAAIAVGAPVVWIVQRLSGSPTAAHQERTISGEDKQNSSITAAD